jgi:hypothetical protein
MCLSRRSPDVEEVLDAKERLAAERPELVRSFEEFQRSYAVYLRMSGKPQQRRGLGITGSPTEGRWR